jgi:hypothetical protein
MFAVKGGHDRRSEGVSWVLVHGTGLHRLGVGSSRFRTSLSCYFSLCFRSFLTARQFPGVFYIRYKSNPIFAGSSFSFRTWYGRGTRFTLHHTKLCLVSYTTSISEKNIRDYFFIKRSIFYKKFYILSFNYIYYKTDLRYHPLYYTDF